MSENSLSRRDFFTRVALGVGAAGVVGLLPSTAVASGGDKANVVVPDDAGMVTLDLNDARYAALKQSGGCLKVAVKHQKRPVLVMRTGDTAVRALSSRCTHLGCEVDLPKDGAISCPCHGSIFSLEGAVTHGPAGDSLTDFSAHLDTEKQTITFKVV